MLQLRSVGESLGASQFDRETWAECHFNPTELISISQEKFGVLFIAEKNDTTEVVPGMIILRIPAPPLGQTEEIRPVTQRQGQFYFRDVIFNTHDDRYALPVSTFAVHILPWHSHPAGRLNIRNGISLNYSLALMTI